MTAITAQAIAHIKLAAAQYGVEPWDILGRSRKRPICRARQTAMRGMAADGEHPKTIAAMLGLDRTTVLHALGRRAGRGKRL